jgi:cytochrome c-type biogenesis protein CcmH/NrfF
LIGTSHSVRFGRIGAAGQVETFQWVTGRKSDHLIADPPTEADHWMLYTISALIIAISLVILTAAARRKITFDICLLGILGAAALATIDMVYVVRGTIFANLFGERGG